jgi:hypothetical protein
MLSPDARQTDEINITIARHNRLLVFILATSAIFNIFQIKA